MITRIVKMTFHTEQIESFLEVFRTAQPKIAAFSGCHGVSLYRDILHSHIFFTYSIWDNSDALENYRQSELFAVTWSKTKILFSDKPEAWSIQNVM